MDFFFNTLKKVLTFGLALSIVTVFVYVPQEYGEVETVPEAEAIFGIPGTPDIVFDPANVANTATTLVKTISLQLKEFALDGVARALAQAVLSQMVASTITWINNGFRGSPAFIQDLDGFLVDVADQTAGNFIQELGADNPLSFLCSPFALDIQIALAMGYTVARERQPYRGCRISEFSGDFERFIEGEFSQGGWQDWFRVVAEPEIYTPLGARLVTEQALQENVRAAQSAESRNLANNQGFLSIRVCEDEPTTSGSSTQSDIGTSNPNAADVANNCRIATPGRVIAERLTESLGIGDQSLLAADEINEILSALFSRLAIEALTGTAGLLGLSRGTGFTYSGFNGGSFVEALQAETTQAAGANLANSLPDMEATLTRQREFLAAASARNIRASTLLNLHESELSTLEPGELAAVEQVRSETANLIQELNGQKIPALEAAIAEYRRIEQQLSAANVSTAETNRLRQQQIQLVSTVQQAGMYTEQQISSTTQRWDAVLNNV